MAIVSERLYTLTDLAALPNDGTRYELLRGALLRVSSSSIGHGMCAARIMTRIGAYALDQKLGETFIADAGFLLEIDPATLLAPDGSFISAERMKDVDNHEKFSSVVPDLVVEVVSPSDTSNEVNDNVLEYLKAGVEIVLVVHPLHKTVTVYGSDRQSQILTVDDRFDGGNVLPGFRLPVLDIFSQA